MYSFGKHYKRVWGYIKIPENFTLNYESIGKRASRHSFLLRQANSKKENLLKMVES